MNEKKSSSKMELLITLNKNIIIQRDMNISSFDLEAKNSLEFLYFMDNLKEFIMTHLSRKSSDYMIEYKDEIVNNPKFMYAYDTEEDEIFNIYIKRDGAIIAHREIQAKLFPAVVRYRLDIRPFIKSIKDELSYIFTKSKRKELTYDYLGYSLI